MGWVDPWVGLGWVEIFQFLVGWVGSIIAKILKFEKIMLMYLKHNQPKPWVNPAHGQLWLRTPVRQLRSRLFLCRDRALMVPAREMG